MARVWIIGAGAVGLVLADAAVCAGHEVTLHGSKAPETVTVIRGDEVRTSGVVACREPQPSERADLAVIAVKRQGSQAAAAWLEEAGGARAVLLAQNGLHDADTPGVHPGVVWLGATRLSAGVAVRTSGDRLAVQEEAASVARFFDADTVRVDAVPDIRAEQWRKFAVNVCAGGLTTLFDTGFGIFRDLFVQIIARAVLDEIVEVALADGVRLDGEFPAQVIEELQQRPPDGTTSLLRDHRAGRPLERDAHSGGLVAIAERLGVPVPVNERLLTALTAPRVPWIGELAR